MADSILARLDSLPKHGKANLRDLWQELFKTSPSPKLRRDLMVRILAHRLQEQAFGALGGASHRRLRELARTFETDPNAGIPSVPGIKPGTRLVRQWREQVHVVNIEEKGYEYKGVRYESLSEIARLITGTRWSGPLFFGLKGKQSKESRRSNER